MHHVEFQRWSPIHLEIQAVQEQPAVLRCTGFEMWLLCGCFSVVVKWNLDRAAAFIWYARFGTWSAALHGSSNRTGCACRQANSSLSLLSGGIKGRPVQTQHHVYSISWEKHKNQTNLSQRLLIIDVCFRNKPCLSLEDGSSLTFPVIVSG